MTRFDRAFRSIRDFVDTCSTLESAGVHPAPLGPRPGTNNTANGRAMLQLMAGFAR